MKLVDHHKINVWNVCPLWQISIACYANGTLSLAPVLTVHKNILSFQKTKTIATATVSKVRIIRVKSQTTVSKHCMNYISLVQSFWHSHFELIHGNPV